MIPTIQEAFDKAREEAGDTSAIVRCTLALEQLAQNIYSITTYDPKEFAKYPRGDALIGFTAWTEQRVYFPIKYDGSVWIGSAPRDPCNELVRAMGGG